MSQHDLDIANQTFPNTRSDLNNALKALGSTSSGATVPSTTYANQLWYDTANNKLYIRNEDNDANIEICELDQTNDSVEFFKADSIRTALVEYTDGTDALTVGSGGELTTSSTLDVDGNELILDSDGDTSITADTDDQIDIKVGGTDSISITPSQITITDSDSGQPRLLLKNTNADSTSPFLDFQKDSASPADNDVIGKIRFIGDDDGGNTVAYATISSTSPDVSDGSENGDLRFETIVDGTNAERMRIDSSGNVGIGTSSPSSPLEVVGGAPLASGFTQSRSGHPTFGITNGGTDSIYFHLAPIGGSHQTFMQVRDDGTAVDSIAFSTSVTEAMRIDASCRVTIASIPSFLAYFGTSSDATISSGSDYVFDDTKYNVGSHYNTSNGRFTAPVAGLYEFNFSAYYTNSGGSTARMQTAWKINGSEYSGTDAIGLLLRDPNSCGGVITGEQTVVFDLSANDYVTVFARSGINRVYRGHCNFSGRLIG